MFTKLAEVDLYKSLMDTTPDVVTIIDLNGVIKFRSKNSMDIYKRSDEEILEKDGYIAVTDKYKKIVEDGIKEVVTKGYVRGLVVEHLRGDGTTFTGENNATLLKDKDGKPLGIMITTRDITDLVIKNKLLKDTENKYKTLFNDAVDGIFVHDMNGKFIDVNQVACERLLYTKAELLNMNLNDIDSPSSQKLIKERMEVLNKNGYSTFNSEHISKDGKVYPVEIAAKIIELNGQPTIISIARDLTERKNLEEQLQQAQKMEVIGRLSGGIAHNFNNLLTVIRGYSSVLLSNKDVSNRDELLEIEKASNRAVGVVKQLLAFSRKQIMKPVVLDINQVLKDINKILSTLIGEGIKINYDLTENIGKIYVDPIQVEQVIINLAVNSKDAMNSVGELTIKTEICYLTREQVSPQPYLSKGEYVKISVTDTGCGMTKDIMDHMFEPFFTTKEKERGTGLGLPTVYGIVKQSNGYIFCQSEVDKGTTFEICLPVIDASYDLKIDKNEDTSAFRGTETILLVEDEDIVRRFTKIILEKHGYKIIEADSPDVALKFCNDPGFEIDLLLTDVVLPKLNGKELSEKMCSIHPNAKVIFVSGYTENTVIHQGILIEGVNFIQKPFTVFELVSKVRQVLDN